MADDGSVYSAGYFSYQSVNFNPNGSDIHVPQGYTDVFITKQTFFWDTSQDSDADGMLDTWELTYFGDLTRDGSGDYDGDGISDLQEYLDGTDPTNIDNDLDGMPDPWEIYHFGSTQRNGLANDDGDALIDYEEFVNETHPFVHNTTGRIIRDGWLVSSDSEELTLVNGGVENAVDNNDVTAWTSAQQPVLEAENLPNEIVINMGRSYMVAGFSYQPELAGADLSEGTVKEYEIYLSQDGLSWGQPVAIGEFDWVNANNSSLSINDVERVVGFKPQNAQYVRFVALSNVQDSVWVSAAEVNVIAPARIRQVTKLTDTADGVCDADCSLREAIIAANALPGLEMIELADDQNAYNLSLVGLQDNDGLLGDLDISDDLIIIGKGVSRSIIDANGIDRIFHVHPGTFSYLNNLLVRNGVAIGASSIEGLMNSSGAGLLNEGGYVTVDHSRFESGRAWSGGAISNEWEYWDATWQMYVTGTPMTHVNIRYSEITGNCGNTGGAIDGAGNFDIIETTVIDNGYFAGCPTDPDGGFDINYGRVKIQQSTIKGNASRNGVIYTWSGDFSIIDSAIVENSGPADKGALNLGPGLLDIRNSTIAKNQGSGLRLRGVEAKVLNSTIAENAGTEGGGIYIYPDYNNPTGEAQGIVEIGNSILAMNSAAIGADCYDVTSDTTINWGEPVPSPFITSLGGNIVTDTTNCDIGWGVLDQVNTGTSPILGIYSDLGTPGSAHYSLGSNSIAIDTGVDSLCSKWDQLGTERPQNGDVSTPIQCDVGAIEYIGTGP